MCSNFATAHRNNYTHSDMYMLRYSYGYIKHILCCFSMMLVGLDTGRYDPISILTFTLLLFCKRYDAYVIYINLCLQVCQCFIDESISVNNINKVESK